jgi:hypothetical protein
MQGVPRGQTILENGQVDVSNLGLVGFSDPIYVHVNTTVTTALRSKIMALSIGVSVDPQQAGRHSFCRVTERAWGEWIRLYVVCLCS